MTRSLQKSFWLVAVLVGTAACGIVQPHDPAPPPVEGRDLTVWLVTLEGTSGHAFFVRNDSERTYRLTRVTLRRCSNVAECGPNPIDVLVCPGEAVRFFDSRPERLGYPMEGVYFDWDFESRSYEPGEPVPGSSCG